uniref:Uncharacterized protein n=1 Tax=Avena sativa TaxID=4498 RepID=A0ACD5YI11_AVESA
MAAKTTSCFTFLKEALVLPTRNPKLFTPVLLLLAITPFLISSVQVLVVQPLAYDMSILLLEMANVDPSSPEYAKILEEIKRAAVKLVLIVIIELVVTLALALVNQILAFFAASTTYSGDRYTLAELIHEISKWSALSGPFITIAVVTALDFAWMAALGTLLSVMMRGGGGRVLSVQGLVFVLGFLAFLYFTVLALVGVAASVIDEEYRGVRALRLAWRLMTRVKRKEGLVLVLVAHLLPTVVTPLYWVALLYAKKSMAVALCTVYAVLAGAQQVFNLGAATVYYYEAMESKDVSHRGYAKIPSWETNV